LVADLRGALDTRRWPRLPLTTKLLENAVEGAAPAAARPGFKAATATNSQAATASAWSSGGKGSSASTDMGNGTRSNGGGGGIDGEPEANSPAEVQVLWQQLAMCVVVKLVRRAMEAPPLEASEQLFRFTVEAHSVAVHPAAAQQQQHEDRSIESLQDALSCTPVSSSVDTELQSRHDGPGVSTKGDTSAALSTGSTTAAPVRTNGTAACRVHNVDGDGISSDDEAYEPLVPLAAAQAAAGQLHAAEAMQQGHHSATAPVPEAHAWPLLLAKVEVIAAHAQHCLMASGAAWRAMSLEDDVVAAIAAAAPETVATAATGLQVVEMAEGLVAAAALGAGAAGWKAFCWRWSRCLSNGPWTHRRLCACSLHSAPPSGQVTALPQWRAAKVWHLGCRGACAQL